MKNQVKWIYLAATIPAVAMGFMDQSILPVALPAIQADLHASEASLTWTINSYLLSMAVFILIGGKIADQIGHRKAFLWGIFIFAFFSALCSLSPSIRFLIISRAFQGFGAAMLFPAQTSLIAANFPPEVRGRATGINVSIASFFLIIGPFVGGYLTETLSWRWIFWINLPVAFVGMIMALVFLPARGGEKGRIDIIGFGYFSVFCISTSVLFMQAQEWGWISSEVILNVILAILSLYLLLRREKVAKYPFLDLSIFKIPAYAAVNLGIAVAQVVLMITVFRTVFIETILGYSPTQTGLITSLSSLPIVMFSPLGGYLADKVSPRVPIISGYLLAIFSFVWLGIHSTPSVDNLFAALVCFGLGVTLIFTPSYSTVMLTVPHEKLGLAFGMISTLRMFSATIGLSLIYFYVNLDQKINLDNLGPRDAEINSFSRVHFILAGLLILALISFLCLYRKKEAIHQ